MKSKWKKVEKICLVLLIVGMILIGAGVGLGGKISFRIDFKNHKVTFGNNKVTGEEELSEFSKLVINCDEPDVTVVADGDSYRVEYAVNGKKPAITIKNGEATINAKDKESSFFIFDLSFLTEKTYLIVHIPSGKKLESVSVKGDTGNVKLENLESEDIHINTDTGNVTLDHIEALKCNMTSDTGNIVMKSVKTESVTAKTDTGNIKLSSVDMNELNAKSDTGNITLNDVSIKTADLKTDTGNVKCEIVGKEKDYNINLKTDVGTIKVDGNKQGDQYRKESDKNYKMEIDTDTGNITVNFE